MTGAQRKRAELVGAVARALRCLADVRGSAAIHDEELYALIDNLADRACPLGKFLLALSGHFETLGSAADAALATVDGVSLAALADQMERESGRGAA